MGNSHYTSPVKKQKSSRRNTVEKLVSALANFSETPDSQWGDFFIAMRADRDVLVQSGASYHNETADEFRESTVEWALVELQWWCEDNKISIRNTVKFRLFGLDMASGALEKVDTDSVYQRLRSAPSRFQRQFVLVDAARAPKGLLPALEARIRHIHGEAALKKPLRFKS